MITVKSYSEGETDGPAGEHAAGQERVPKPGYLAPCKTLGQTCTPVTLILWVAGGKRGSLASQASQNPANSRFSVQQGNKADTEKQDI